jgi:Cu-Zn family superoxide dismutase
MKRLLLAVVCATLVAPLALAREISLTVHELDRSGIGASIGVIIVKDTPQGLMLQPHLHNMKPGVYAFSVNETMACHSGHRGDGNMIPGLAAGDPIRELPQLEVGNDGIADQAVYAAGLSTRDLSKRTLVISRGDETGVFGGLESGGRRVACASLEQY